MRSWPSQLMQKSPTQLLFGMFSAWTHALLVPEMVCQMLLASLNAVPSLLLPLPAWEKEDRDEKEPKRKKRKAVARVRDTLVHYSMLSTLPLLLYPPLHFSIQRVGGATVEASIQMEVGAPFSESAF